MTRRTLIVVTLTGLLLMSVTRPGAGESPPRATQLATERLRVTTLNVLHDGVRSVAAPWRERRARVVELILDLEPDVLCLQEVSAGQLDDLKQDLPDYEVVAGEASGPIVLPAWPAIIAMPAHLLLGDYFKAAELCPILLRRDSLRATASGSVKLRTPRPARAFKAHSLTWVRAETRSGFTFEVANTHLGILPWRARASGRELLAAMNELRTQHPQILTGDFNSRPSGGVLRELSDDGDPAGFRDAWSEASRRDGGGSTFHWGLGLPGPRIDYVLSRPGLRPRSAKVSGPERGKPRVSDHWAMTVEYEVGGDSGREPAGAVSKR
jgi:endonuclease/exonuclease/phosphatase family metal-dependent hydrolase